MCEYGALFYFQSFNYKIEMSDCGGLAQHTKPALSLHHAHHPHYYNQ